MLPRVPAVLSLGVLLLAVPACDSANPSVPPIVVETPGPTRSVIARPAPIEGLAPGTYAVLALQLPQSGTMDITVDWTFDNSWIFVYFGQTECSYRQLSQGTCPLLLTSETKEPKPRVLVTEPLGPGAYYVYLHNVERNVRAGTGSDNTESVAVEVGLTVAAAPAGRP